MSGLARIFKSQASPPRVSHRDIAILKIVFVFTNFLFSKIQGLGVSENALDEHIYENHSKTEFLLFRRNFKSDDFLFAEWNFDSVSTWFEFLASFLV